VDSIISSIEMLKVMEMGIATMQPTKQDANPSRQRLHA